MTVFTIDQDNNITAFASGKKADSNPESERFRSAKELDKLARKWPGSRVIEIWNSLPGVSPVRKFTSRQVAIDRIWKAIQNLAPEDAAQAPSLAKKRTRAATLRPRIRRRVWAAKLRQCSSCYGGLKAPLILWPAFAGGGSG